MLLTKPLREQFIASCHLPDPLFQNIVAASRENAISFALRVIQLGHLERKEAGSIIGNAIGYPYLNLRETLFDANVVARLSVSEAISFQVIPVNEKSGHMILATDNPIGLPIDQLPDSVICKLKVVFTFPDELESAIAQQYQFSQLGDLTPQVNKLWF